MKIRSIVGLVAILACQSAARADDWPQFRGPRRDDVSTEKGLLTAWPKNGPRELWSYSKAGRGYSGPAVVGQRLYTLGAIDGKEYVLAFDVATGKRVWESLIAPIFENRYGDGPRGTPTVDGDALYALGGQSELVCVDLATGKNRWHVNLQEDLGGKHQSGWGYTESPLVDGEVVVCEPGGSGGTMAAFNKQTGKVVWRSTELKDEAAYSSIIAADVEGVRQYIGLTAKAVVGVAARDGKLLWRYPVAGFATAVIPTPIYHDGFVYATAGYGCGCEMVKLTKAGAAFRAEKVYKNKIMTNHHGGVVLVGDYLYGYSDSERGWICQDFKTGQLVWKETRKLGKGSITYADGHLYCYGEQGGELVLIEASPAGWKESGRFKIPKESEIRSDRGHIWTHPVVANGMLFLRDQDLLYCFEVKAGSGATAAR